MVKTSYALLFKRNGISLHLELGFAALNPTYGLERLSLTESCLLRKMVRAIYKEIGFFQAAFKTIFHDVFN